MEAMWSYRDRLESNRTPRLRANEMDDKVTVGIMKKVLNLGMLWEKTNK